MKCNAAHHNLPDAAVIGIYGNPICASLSPSQKYAAAETQHKKQVNAESSAFCFFIHFFSLK